MQKLSTLKKLTLKAPLARDGYYSKVYARVPAEIRQDYENKFNVLWQEGRWALGACGSGGVLGALCFALVQFGVVEFIPTMHPLLSGMIGAGVVFSAVAFLGVDMIEDDWKAYREAEYRCVDAMVNPRKEEREAER